MYVDDPRELHVREVMGWEIAARVLACNRHLRVMILHPGGGQYDVLSLRDRRSDDPFGRVVCELNRPGSILIPGCPEHPDWPSTTEGAERVARLIIESAEVKPAAKPPKRPAPHVAAFIAEALRRGGPSWRCLPALHDSSGMEGSFLDDRVLDMFDRPRNLLEHRADRSFTITDQAYGWFALESGGRYDEDRTSHLLLAMKGEAWLPRQEWPHATRPAWPECGEDLLRRIGLAP